MNRWRKVFLILFVLLVPLVGFVLAHVLGIVDLPSVIPSYPLLEEQLRDRGTVAVAGRVPFFMRRRETLFTNYEKFPTLANALNGRDATVVATTIRALHLEGILVRTDRPQGAPGSVLHSLSTMAAVRGLNTVYLDDTSALYEPAETIALTDEEARQLIDVTRLILRGAPAPPQRLFSPTIRRTMPTEVAVIVREGRVPLIWRAWRGSSIGGALIEATYAVFNRWNTRQEQQHGQLRAAIERMPITIAIFYDRASLGTRSPEFLARAVNPRVFSLGYQDRSEWEYVLPPAPWAPIAAPAEAIRQLAEEHDLAPPGYLRPEISVYRFRALQLVEHQAQGTVEVFDPLQ